MTELVYSGKTTSFHHKWNNTPNPEHPGDALKKVWFLNVQWSDCPIEVMDEVILLWGLFELGNDRYILKMSVNDLLLLKEEGCEGEVFKGKWVKVPIVNDYLVDLIRKKGIPDNEEIIIHYWW